MVSSKVKHSLHVTLFVSVIVVCEILTDGLHLKKTKPDFDPFVKYGVLVTLFFYSLRLLTLFILPQISLNFCGLILYNAFPDKVKLKGSPLLAPFICIRIVTRGDYPRLVQENVFRNLNKCLDAGLEHFVIEVVTDKPINLAKNRRILETVVPKEYKTKNGTMYKARALQYCLEDGVNSLSDSDWIVHLDEETLLTENSIRGILNFALDGSHCFGQGLITYANEEVVNWVTTLADSFRVAEDMGKLRVQFSLFHRPILSWKGSYVVTQVKAERQVTFDNGPDGSIAEDCFFAMKAYSLGYTFDFIEGEMWEKSPFTLLDFVQQRKRWLQGILLVVHSKEIPLGKKIWLSMSCYAWITLPLTTSNYILAYLSPVPCPPVVDFLNTFIAAVSIYMYIFGVVKSISLYRFGIVKFTLCLIGAVATIPLNLVIENLAVIWGIFSNKHKFYIVDKDVRSTLTIV